MRDQLRLMGTGDSLGVPWVYCECGVCQEARPSALLGGPGGDQADSVRWTGLPVRLLGPAPALDEIRARYSWVVSWIPMEPVDGLTVVAGWSVTCWPVNHGRSFACRFERPGFTWAYSPDSIDLRPDEKAPPRERRSLYSMVEALALLDRVKPGRTVFTHRFHGVDCRADYRLPPGVTLGHDGMEIDLEGRRQAALPSLLLP